MPAPPADALVHGFDADHGRRDAEELAELLGAKGATLATLTRMGLPVPAGFTLTTRACRRYLAGGWDDELERSLRDGAAALEEATGTRLGDPVAPLLVSVRSGAPVSMPGMLATVLDVGLTPAVLDGLVDATDDASFVADTQHRARRGWRAVLRQDPPTDPVDQLRQAVQVVFGSWNSSRARHYREIEGIDEDLGTAATVQVMVFGNRSERSGTGVAFTRDPSTGAPGLVGDFLVGAQGDDVVDGGRATLPLSALRDRWPEVWDGLVALGARLERHFVDLVDIEFTVDDGTLWLLQARPGKRSTAAALQVAVDLAEDPAFPLDRRGAVERCRDLLAAPAVRTGPAVDPPAPGDGADVVAVGVAASPGRAVGVVCTDVERTVQLAAEGIDVVLVRRETSPGDVQGIAAGVGLVTSLGGLVSHAAVVARSWGLPAVVGAADLRFVDGGVVGPGGGLAEGEVVTVDGDGGRLLRGPHPSGPTERSVALATLLRWAEENGFETDGRG